MNNADIIAKLQKILARADATRNPSQAEVETAMRMAQELAAKHNLELGDIKLADDGAPPPLDIIKDEVAFATDIQVYHRYMWMVLDKCFQVHQIWTHTYVAGKSRPAVIMVGEKADVSIARYVWGYLERAFPDCYADWKKAQGRGGYVSRDVRHSWYLGFAEGIIESNHRAVKEVIKGHEQSYALTVVNKEALVAVKVKELFPRLRKATGGARSAGDYGARHAGRAAGRSVKLATGAIQ